MKKQNSAAVDAAVDAINSKTDAKLKEKRQSLKRNMMSFSIKR